MNQPIRHETVAVPRRSNAAAAAVGTSSVPKMFVLLVAAWLFDFQSGGQGEAVDLQGLFAAAYLFALVILLIGDRAAGQRIQGLFALVVTGALYLGVGMAVGILSGQEIYPILRNSLNVGIYLTGAYATARTVMVARPEQLRFVLSVLCLLYAISSYIVFNLTSGGVDLERVRFQIIGASAIAALGYVVLAALFKLTKIELAAMAVNGVVLLLAITRSFLLVLAAQASIFIGQIRRVFSPRLILLGVAGGVALLGVLAYGQQQLGRWSERIMGGGGSDFAEYQTFYTRLSEWDFMLSSWTQSIDHFLFGSGIAAKTVYYLPRSLGGGSEYMIGFGHNQHLSILFTAGAIGGLPFLLLQLFQGVLAWRFLRRTIRFAQLRNNAVFLGAWGATMVLGNLAINVVSSTFTARAPSLWYGIGTGLLLGAQALFDPANRPHAALRPAPRPSRYLSA